MGALAPTRPIASTVARTLTPPSRHPHCLAGLPAPKPPSKPAGVVEEEVERPERELAGTLTPPPSSSSSPAWARVVEGGAWEGEGDAMEGDCVPSRRVAHLSLHKTLRISGTRKPIFNPCHMDCTCTMYAGSSEVQDPRSCLASVHQFTELPNPCKTLSTLYTRVGFDLNQNQLYDRVALTGHVGADLGLGPRP